MYMNIVLNKPDTERKRLSMGEEPGKLFVGGIHSQVTKDEFKAFFNDAFGEVIDAVLMFDPETKKSRGFGFVTFKEPSAASKVLSSGPHMLNGKQVDCKPSVRRGDAPPSKRPHQSIGQDNYRKVFVGGIAQGTTKEGLKNFFSTNDFFVTDIVLMLDSQTQKSRGFAFVTFAEDIAVERVCSTRFFNIDGKTVECKKAEPRQAGQGGPGQGGGFNQMQRGDGPNMGGGPHGGSGGGFNNPGWNQNQGYNQNAQFNQGGGGGGNFGQGNFNQQQQQQPYGQNRPMSQGNFSGPFNGNAGGYGQQQQTPPQQQQQPYGAGYQQQQQQPAQQQQPQQQQGNYAGQPQNYNYNYTQQQQQQPAQQQQQQPNQYNNQTPQQQTTQQYNTGNMGNYPQEASGYGPQRVNYNSPGPQGNFNQPQGTDMSGGYQQQQPQQQQPPQAPQQQPGPPQQQPQQQQQNYQQPAGDTSNDVYGAGTPAAANFNRGSNNAQVAFHPYRR